MRFTLPANAFPDITLTTDEQKALIDEANKVLDETILVNEAFIDKGKQFPRNEWKPVRSKEGINVYKQRQTTAMQMQKARAASHGSSTKSERNDSSLEASASSGNSVCAPSTQTSAANVTSYVETLKRPQVPLLALFGSLDGTLEDTMYGCFADTDDSWRWRSTHVDERFDDAKILAKVLGPTPAEPFRFLGVKWFIKEHPVVLNQFVKRRDFLILEATGITKDSKGDPVGYLLMHSVGIARIPELKELDVTRANLSFCFLIRPNTETTVDIYCRGFTDPQGEMIERVSVLIAAESLISAVSVVDYAYIKKLKWLMGKRQQQHINNANNNGVPFDQCGSCQRSLNKFGILSPSGSACHICRKVCEMTLTNLPCVYSTGMWNSLCILLLDVVVQIVCNRCSVVKKVAVDLTVDAVVHKSLKFCLGCVLEAKEMPAWDLASATLPPPPQDELRGGVQPQLKRVSSRGRQRMRRAASAYSSTSSVRSEKGTRVPRTPRNPSNPTDSPTESTQERKVASGRNSEATNTSDSNSSRSVNYIL